MFEPNIKYRQAARILASLVGEACQLDDVPKAVLQFIDQVLENRRPVGVIFYGSTLRTKDITGLLDFYIIVDQLSDWPQSFPARMANALLPPNVHYYEKLCCGQVLRAKVAVLTLAQLEKATCFLSYDTTMWARFCQPVKLVWTRGKYEEKVIIRCLFRAMGTAGQWAAMLGPAEGKSKDYWQNLFANTYGAELRVEGKNRPSTIMEGRENYYTQLLSSVWNLSLIRFTEKENIFVPEIDPKRRFELRQKWRFRKKVGRPLNIIRLIKAAFTFEGGADYLAWKIERHSGIHVNISSFARRYPLLCAPWILLKLYRQGAFKRSI